MKFKILAFLLLLASMATVCHAQNVAVKSNLFYDATTTLNAGVEVKFAPQWTGDLSANLNAWAISDHRWKHWLVQPELRYWFCEAFSGHFVGAHLLGGQYNFGNLNMPFTLFGSDFRQLKDYRFQGWAGGLGVAYGYSWILDKHWNIEAEIGLGWLYTRYDKFECADCGQRVARNRPHNYVGPTKAAVNLVYTF